MKEEIRILRRVQKYLEEFQYPGYPFAINGIVDMGTQKCYLGYHGKALNFESFREKFDALLAYQMVGCNLAEKGSFLNDSKMADHEKFLQADFEDFYIDNMEATQLYFAFYAAYREADTNSIIFFQCDGDSDYVDVKIFKDGLKETALSQIKKYKKELMDETKEENEYGL